VNDDRIPVQLEVVRGIVPVEYIFHIEDGQVELVVAPFDEFGEFLVEFLDVGFLAVEVDLIAPCNYLQTREIRTEFLEYLVPSPEYLDRVRSFKRNGFLHYL
jgi:hypothetical protein